MHCEELFCLKVCGRRIGNDGGRSGREVDLEEALGAILREGGRLAIKGKREGLARAWRAAPGSGMARQRESSPYARGQIC